VAGDRLPWSDELDEPGITLLGWLVESGTYEDGLDRDDPLTGGIDGTGYVPVPAFLDWTQLSADTTGTRFSDPQGRHGAYITRWGDENKRGRRDDHEGRWGQYLAVRRDLLIEYLSHRGVSLALTAHAHAHTSGGPTSREAKDDRRWARFWILHADGQIRSVEIDQTFWDEAFRRH
jgi:hypothetical protein